MSQQQTEKTEQQSQERGTLSRIMSGQIKRRDIQRMFGFPSFVIAVSLVVVSYVRFASSFSPYFSLLFSFFYLSFSVLLPHSPFFSLFLLPSCSCSCSSS